MTAGGGSHSGRSMRHAGTVIALAVTELIVTAKAIIAEALEVPAADIEFEAGLFRLPMHNESLNWFEVADLIVRHGLEALWPKGLRVVQDNEMHTPVFPTAVPSVKLRSILKPAPWSFVVMLRWMTTGVQSTRLFSMDKLMAPWPKVLDKR